MNNTTMGSEGLKWLDRAYTLVSRPATFSVSFITSPISQLLADLINLDEGGALVLTVTGARAWSGPLRWTSLY